MSGVTVLLPTFNRAGLIAETIDSLLAQTRPVDEIIVINDGSTDDTSAVLAPYGDRLRVLTKTNGGKSAALNMGLAEAREDRIWIADDDDIILPDTAARLMGTLDADPTLDFCAGLHKDFTVDPATGAMTIHPPGHSRCSRPDEIFPDLLEGCHIFQPGLMVRRRVYGVSGPFRSDLVRSQDYEMILRIARKNRGVVIPEVVFLHREHEGDRGSSELRFSADQNATRWKTFNGIIFSSLLADLQDEELLPASLWQATPIERRARLAGMKRACIMARQRMWPECIATWDRLVMDDKAPLDAEELALLDRSTSSPLGCPELFEDHGVQVALTALARRNELGRFIVRRLARRVRWYLRKAIGDRDLGATWRVSRFLILAA